MFARCIELEEQLENITIESVRSRHEEEIENLRFELDTLWKERRQWKNWNSKNYWWERKEKNTEYLAALIRAKIDSTEI